MNMDETHLQISSEIPSTVNNQTMDVDCQEALSDSFNDVEFEDPNSSITSKKSISSFDDSFENSFVTIGTKKIKVSKEKSDSLKAEREKLKQEREMLKIERERARLEKEKARFEKERMKLEREQKLKEEREKKLQEIQEKKVQLEKEKQEKLRLKEEEKEKKERERKEKEEEKIKLREAKEKEKLRRQEEKIAMEEERKKKEELKAKVEEEKLEKSRAVLFNFLKKTPNDSIDNLQNNSSFMALNDEKTDTVTIVPKSLLELFDHENFFVELKAQNENIENLYLNCLLLKRKKPYVQTFQVDDEMDTEEELPEQYKNVKYIYLQFCENVKPPYFGPKPLSTVKVNGRRPFSKEESLDYEIDSDEEWDEGGPGESLSGSDSDQEEKDDYEIDNDFFVPHGYLSDDECDKVLDDDDDKPNSGPLLKEQALMAERSRRFSQQLKPQVIGCVWEENKNDFLDKYEFLAQFKRVLLPK